MAISILMKVSLIIIVLFCFGCHCNLKGAKHHAHHQQLRRHSVCNTLQIDQLFMRKDVVEKKLKLRSDNVDNDQKLSDKEKSHRKKIIEIIHREINDSVVTLHGAADSLGKLLRGDHISIQNLKEISKQHLAQLQASMLITEEDHNALVDEEKTELQRAKQNSSSPSKNILTQFFNDVLGDIKMAADKLETDLDDDAFEAEIHSKDKNYHVETVVKVTGEESADINSNEGVVLLIDSESNLFVLAKPKDTTTTHIDHNLLKEIIYITSLSFVLVIIGNLLNMPSNFACVLAGVFLGPSGGNYIKNMVQIETMGEFGVFFMLFSVGLEFSLDKLKKVLRESLIGVLGIFTILTLIGLFWGSIFGFLPRQSIFVTLCLAFSSTPLITKLLQNHNSEILAAGAENNYVDLLLAMLVIEDALLGILMATLPLIAGHTPEKSHSLAHVPLGPVHNFVHGAFGGPGEALFFTLFELVVGLTGIFLIAFVLSKYVAARFFRGLNFSGSHESFVLGIMSAVFFMLLITEYFGVSMELGCFISGTIMGTMGEQTTRKVTLTVEPFKDFFASLFFASIGFHVFPSFVASELAIFIPITTLVVLTKLTVASGVLHFILPKDNNSKWVVAAGLAQMSEFAFLLASRARRFGLIGREVFLIILSMTTLSLFFSPIIWKFIHSKASRTLFKRLSLK